MAKEKRKPGERFDGIWLRDEAPALSQFMAWIMPNRTDNEAHIEAEFDARPLDKYLAKKNEGLGEDKYSYMHIFLAACVKCFVLRPKMNRFIAGNRVYQRKELSVAFVVKKRFADGASEGLAFKRYTPADTVDTLHTSILEEIHQCRREDVVDNSTNAMETVIKLPRFLLRIVANVLMALDRRGKVPYELIKADPNYSSVFVTNLGSIGMDSGYHHLNNWGTNSFFAVIGKKKLSPEWKEDGGYELRPVIPVGFTLDERIADGYYYAGTIRLLKKLLENPELLELPFDTPVEY